MRAGIERLRAVWFTLVQTSVAAGLSWYLAHDVLRHPQPFFAPIAAAVSLSIGNVLRAQRAVQMMIGVTVGIGVGRSGQGMMFANQTAISAILVPALYRSGIGFVRIFDALIGGAVAVVFAVVLFPADPPAAAARRARRRAGHPGRGVVGRRGGRRRAPTAGPCTWPCSRAPCCGGPASSRPPPAAAGHRPARPRGGDGAGRPRPRRVCAYLRAGRRYAVQLQSDVRGGTDVVIADAVAACIDDLQAVIDLRPVGLRTSRPGIPGPACGAPASATPR